MSDNTSDIVDRLRQWDQNSMFGKPLLLEAADEIERLHAKANTWIELAGKHAATCDEKGRDIDRLGAETERLKLDNEQLRHMNQTMFERDEGQKAEIARLEEETLRLLILLNDRDKGPSTPADLLFFETTPAMRERLRELSSADRKDDYDRVVLLLLGDFARLLAYVAPLHDAVSRLAVPSSKGQD